MKFIKYLAVALVAMGLATTAAAQVGSQVADLPDNPDQTFRTAEGQEVRQYAMTVMGVGRRHITVQFSDGTRNTYRVPNDFRFNIEGEDTPLSGIYPRQKLRAYFYYNDGAWQLAQPAEFETMESEPVVIAAVAESAPEEDLQPRMDTAPAMPKTAGSLPLVALIGALMLLAAGGLRMSRIGRG